MNKTVRLFDLDASAEKFEARVISVEARGDKYEVILDQTLFFPEEGGQASDTGMLGDARVLGAREKDGVIYHLVDTPLAADANVAGKIDFAERFRKMQSHTAEHIVSGLIWRNFGLHNVGFHLSADSMTADFDGWLDEKQLRMVETLANQAVYECRGVKGYYPDADELAKMEYRSKLELFENVRIVEIDGVDKCACCAPHVGNTGEIGMIRILSGEKYKSGIRLYMKVGSDALADCRAEYEQVRRISVAISVKREEIADGVERLLGEMDQLKSRIGALKRELMAYKLASIRPTDGNLCLFEEDGDMLALRNLVNEAKQLCGGVCAVFAGTDEQGYKYIVSSTSVDLKAKAKEINLALCGRGGGSSEMIQGSCREKRSVIEAFFAGF